MTKLLLILSALALLVGCCDLETVEIHGRICSEYGSGNVIVCNKSESDKYAQCDVLCTKYEDQIIHVTRCK